MDVNEHENARRVLEQAIMDRLPKVEQRLAEARKLLVQRDREIAVLTETSDKQTTAIEEATQINIQQADELHRVRAALETRAARNRETLGDPRFDGEVALRTEIEALRAKTRDQSAMLERLQGAGEGAVFAFNDENGTGETGSLKAALAKAEAELAAIMAEESGDAAARSALEEQTQQLERQVSGQTSEITRLKASLKAYEDVAADSEAGRESQISSKAEFNALQAEVDEQRRTIQALRAEVASNNERLARQAQHFRDEMRRLGSGAASVAAAPSVRTVTEQPRRSLAERIAQPRVSGKMETSEPKSAGAPVAGNGGAETRQSGFLRALNGGAAQPEPLAAADVEADGHQPPANSNAEESQDVAPRRSRLLDRISGIDKS